MSDSSSDNRPAPRGGTTSTSTSEGTSDPTRSVPVAWEALEDAFENNAPEVHSYLQLEAGEVIRIVDGVADPAMHARVAADDSYLRIDPVSSREQYRWMERFIETVDDSELRERLSHAIDGKGAFRRFKDVLMSYPVERERWFAFRSERLRSCMEAWLETHGIAAVERPQWRVPSADEVVSQVEQPPERPNRRTRAQVTEAQRGRLHELVDSLPVRELDAATAFLEFLRERRHVPRSRAKEPSSGGADGDAPTEKPTEAKTKTASAAGSETSRVARGPRSAPRGTRRTVTTADRVTTSRASEKGA